MNYYDESIKLAKLIMKEMVNDGDLDKIHDPEMFIFITLLYHYSIERGDSPFKEYKEYILC